MDVFINIGVSLLTTVSILVLISVGLALVFGMMGIINFAHGEFIMLGAYFTATGYQLGLNLWLAMLVASLSVGVVGLIVERTLIQFLYGRLAATLLATWGLSLILMQLVVLIYGPVSRGVPNPLGSFTVGKYSISQYNLLLIAAAIIVLVFVFVLFTRTKYGIKAQASTQLPRMAAAIGINSKMINMVTFAIGAALAGAAGALLAPITGVVPDMGQTYVGKAFMAVVVGGPGFITGTASASGLLGSVDSIVSNATTPFLGSTALLVVAILLLRFYPTGISGKLGRKL